MIEKLPIALEIAITSTIPQGFACLYFTLMFWGLRFSGMYRRTAVYAVCSGIIFAAVMLLPELLRPVGLLGYIVLLLILFRGLGLRERITVIASMLVLYTGSESLFSFAVLSLGLIDGETLAKDPRSALPYLILLSIAIALAALWLDRSRIAPGKTIGLFLRQPQNRMLSLLALAIAANVIITSALIFYASANQPIAAAYTLFAISLASMILMFMTIRFISHTKNQAILSTQETYVEEIDNLFTTIRGQRHDFLNHVQVIQSFVQMGKMKELERYVTELVGEIVEINDLIQIGNPALAALIKSKLVYALDRKIDLRYSFEGMSRIGRSIASVDYVKIAGNLLDNAIDEVIKLPGPDRWIHIQGSTDEEHLYLCVSNPAFNLTEDVKLNMFRPGFSTKSAASHNGIGLSIVKEQVRRYQGWIGAETTEGVISFKVKLPLGKRDKEKL